MLFCVCANVASHKNSKLLLTFHRIIQFLSNLVNDTCRMWVPPQLTLRLLFRKVLNASLHPPLPEYYLTQ